MGCLTVTVEQRDKPKLTAKGKVFGDPLCCEYSNINTEIIPSFRFIPCDVNIQKNALNIEVVPTTINKNVEVGVSISLICQIGYEVYEYFDVLQGHFVVEDGYLKVLKV